MTMLVAASLETTFKSLLSIFYPPIYHWNQHRSQLYIIQIRSKNRNLNIGNEHNCQTTKSPSVNFSTKISRTFYFFLFLQLIECHFTADYWKARPLWWKLSLFLQGCELGLGEISPRDPKFKSPTRTLGFSWEMQFQYGFVFYTFCYVVSQFWLATSCQSEVDVQMPALS